MTRLELADLSNLITARARLDKRNKYASVIFPSIRGRKSTPRSATAHDRGITKSQATLVMLMSNGAGGDMTIAKRFGWMVIGIVIGGIGSSSLLAARWAQGAPPGRLVVVAGSKLSEGVVGKFIKDMRTGACWLSIPSRDDLTMALAPAPAESCQQ
jgi:hypothetical protein